MRLPIDISRDRLTRDYRKQFATRSARDVDDATSSDTRQAAETFIQRAAAEIHYQQPSPAIPSTLALSHNQKVSSRITRQDSAIDRPVNLQSILATISQSRSEPQSATF